MARKKMFIARFVDSSTDQLKRFTLKHTNKLKKALVISNGRKR